MIIIILLSKPHIRYHTCTTTHSRKCILLREINKRFDWHDWLTNDEPQTQEWTTYRPLSSLQQATPLLPRTPVFREFISHQPGLRRPTLPKLRHLLMKHRQRQRTSLAITRCFLDFSSSHTPAFTPSHASHASRTVCLSRGAECVVVSMCGCACVVAYVWFW